MVFLARVCTHPWPVWGSMWIPYERHTFRLEGAEELMRRAFSSLAELHLFSESKRDRKRELLSLRAGLQGC